jgi:hypothetical protein
MTETLDGPADRWGFLFYRSGLYPRAHTHQEWAQLAHAITMSDLRHRDGVAHGAARPRLELHPRPEPCHRPGRSVPAGRPRPGRRCRRRTLAQGEPAAVVQNGVFSDDSFLVLVWRPDGPALPSGPVGLDELTAASQTPTDRAVAVLTGVANRLLATAEPEPRPVRGAAATLVQTDVVHEQPLRNGGRAFRLITATADPSPPALPPPPAPPSPPLHPRT